MTIEKLPQPISLDASKTKPGADRAANYAASKLLLALGWKAK